jgi:tripartite-type tricarboxylate transporter receptor subunit TctC
MRNPKGKLMFTHSRACVLALGSYAVATLVYAQPYPAKPIRIIVPGGPGGGIDTVTRLISPPLAAALGQPVIPDNRPGAGTVLASELTAKAAPDGYTFLAVTISHAINAGVQKNLRYDPINDFSEVTLTATVPNLLVVHPSVPAKSVKELIALAKRYPGQLFFASAGSGSGTHLAFELFQAMANVSIVHVPYKSGTPALADVAGGHVQLMFSNTINSGPFVKARRLRALAITSVRRSALYPGLPTIAESGVPGYSSDAWYGVLAPARTPPDIIARLNREIVTLLKARELNEKLAAQGVDVVGSTQEEFAAWMRNEIRKWAKLTSTLKLQTD